MLDALIIASLVSTAADARDMLPFYHRVERTSGIAMSKLRMTLCPQNIILRHEKALDVDFWDFFLGASVSVVAAGTSVTVVKSNGHEISEKMRVWYSSLRHSKRERFRSCAVQSQMPLSVQPFVTICGRLLTLS